MEGPVHVHTEAHTECSPHWGEDSAYVNYGIVIEENDQGNDIPVFDQ